MILARRFVIDTLFSSFPKLTMNLLLVSGVLISLGSISSQANAAPEDYPLGQRSIFSERATQERVAPLGQVCLKGESCAGGSAPAEVVAEAENAGPRSGETIYTNVCSGCHGAGVMGAPKFGDKAAWDGRFKQGQKTLVAHAIKGINAMPAKGGCRDCSDEEIGNAVEYMLKESKVL